MTKAWSTQELVQGVEQDVGEGPLQSIMENAEAAWPEPQSLIKKTEAPPYPVEALPEGLRGAIVEAQSFIKAPMAMVAGSVLAALSTSAQAHIDVRRNKKLHGPASLFLLTIADSGERKSTCDGVFSSPIAAYEYKERISNKPIIKKHNADADIWRAERDGLLAAIKNQARDTEKKGGKPLSALKEKLREHEESEPERPLEPVLLLEDETQESLIKGLGKGWPTVGILSSEGGTVFGSHAMGKDSITRALATYNVLWDGKPLRVGRKTTDSFTVENARLTMAVQIQESVLRDFIIKSGSLARGSGFFARFLVAWPGSTQGTREYSEPPKDTPSLNLYHKRIEEILSNNQSIIDDKKINPKMLSFATEAKEYWVDFFNLIEEQLSAGGEFCETKDVASKTADNAVRLAGLFQIYKGDADEIDIESIKSGCDLALWYLVESKRFFSELALPAELAGALRVDNWIIDYCNQNQESAVDNSRLRQFGPLRKTELLNDALKELVDLDRVRTAQIGRKKIVMLNPALLATS